MKKTNKNTNNIFSRIWSTLLPDEETLHKMAEGYASRMRYYLDAENR